MWFRRSCITGFIIIIRRTHLGRCCGRCYCCWWWWWWVWRRSWYGFHCLLLYLWRNKLRRKLELLVLLLAVYYIGKKLFSKQVAVALAKLTGNGVHNFIHDLSYRNASLFKFLILWWTHETHQEWLCLQFLVATVADVECNSYEFLRLFEFVMIPHRHHFVAANIICWIL